jgi:hypothetical protein
MAPVNTTSVTLTPRERFIAALERRPIQGRVPHFEYALKHGMPGGGYVFGTSNCVYTGMAVKRYEFMLDIWRREGNYI